MSGENGQNPSRAQADYQALLMRTLDKIEENLVRGEAHTERNFESLRQDIRNVDAKVNALNEFKAEVRAEARSGAVWIASVVSFVSSLLVALIAWWVQRES